MLKIVLRYTGWILLVTCLYSSQLTAAELDELTSTGKEIINTYALNMRIAYENAYRRNDPLFIEKVCREQAQKIASHVARDGWTIGRISTEPVNTENIPDQTEQRVLRDFTAKHSRGRDTDQLAWYKLSEVGNLSEFRYIKAFTLEDRCVSCHAGSVSKNGSLPGLAAYSVKFVETKDYFPDEAKHGSQILLPEFEE